MFGFCCSCCSKVLNCSLLTLEAVTNLAPLPAIGERESTPPEVEGLAKLVRGEATCWAELKAPPRNEDFTRGEVALG